MRSHQSSAIESKDRYNTKEQDITPGLPMEQAHKGPDGQHHQCERETAIAPEVRVHN
ncbi:hypothetical protein IQ217_06080 [Synechocystis salina LEGE 00031]|uniref:Uncharacterized protein n=1 Tax=Synechocystis salina LEGE 00031 TaxID=1828736 RepID=A0ABR9VQU2_9SYNC|nr:hypothetical protein [Synechocystis salina LEGE 00031]